MTVGSGPRALTGPNPARKNKDQCAPRELSTNVDIWERQPDETEKAYTAFVEYVSTKPDTRTIDGTGVSLGKAPTVRGWARQWSWRARGRAWDDHLAQQARDAQVSEIRDMQARHLSLSRKMQNLVKVELERMLHHLGVDAEGNGDPTQLPKLGTKEMANILDFAVKMERLNRGESESVTEIRATTVTAADRRAVLHKYIGTAQADEWLDQLADLGVGGDE